VLLLKYPTYNAAYIGERCKDSTMPMVSLSSMDMITSLEVIMILSWSKESYHANQHEKVAMSSTAKALLMIRISSF